jgi:hypothetical protein
VHTFIARVRLSDAKYAVGPLVTNMALHNPTMLAKQALTLDQDHRQAFGTRHWRGWSAYRSSHDRCPKLGARRAGRTLSGVCQPCRSPVACRSDHLPMYILLCRGCADAPTLGTTSPSPTYDCGARLKVTAPRATPTRGVGCHPTTQPPSRRSALPRSATGCLMCIVLNLVAIRTMSSARSSSSRESPIDPLTRMRRYGTSLVDIATLASPVDRRLIASFVWCRVSIGVR